MQQNRPNEFDVAIVGGGVAGTYAAWRIASTPADILNRIIRPSAGQVSIGLFEAERIGGRLLTLDMPGAFFRAELGGMRYTSSHILLRHVISHFGLHAKPFKFVDRLMYLRGRHLKTGSILSGSCESCREPLGIPYRIETNEPNNAVQLVTRAIVAALKKVEFDWAIASPQQATTRELILVAAILAGLREDGSSLT